MTLMFSLRNLVEGVAELRVAVVDEEPERLLVAELYHQVARLLRDPAPVRIGGASDVLDPSRRQRDKEHDVDPLQERSLDGEEIAGEHASRLLVEERPPRQPRSLRRRLQTRPEQHLAHRRRRDADAETLELADERLYPQCGFSRASRTISSRSERSSGGRPAFLWVYVQRRATSWRCQRSSVSGLTARFVQAARGTRRLSAANSARSARVSLARPACRRSTASS
jgi:hypothetical protein